MRKCALRMDKDKLETIDAYLRLKVVMGWSRLPQMTNSDKDALCGVHGVAAQKDTFKRLDRAARDM